MIPQEVGVRRGGQDLALCPERLAQEVEQGEGQSVSVRKHLKGRSG